MAKAKSNYRKRKVAQSTDEIDYKDLKTLERYVSEQGKIVPSRITGVCSSHQRRLAKAIKQARYMALLPFTTQ